MSRRLVADPNVLETLSNMSQTLKVIKQMPFPVSLWSAQNDVYAIQNSVYKRTHHCAKSGDAKAQAWVDSYLQLSELLSIRVV